MGSINKKVIVLGSIAFDYIMEFDENLCNACCIDHEKGEYQSTVTAKSRIMRFGGTAGNISYNLGLINIANVHLFGSVGKDFIGLGYKDHISKFENIQSSIDVHEDLFTAACYIVNDIESNQQIIFHGGALDKTREIDLRAHIKDTTDYVYAINSTQSIDAMTRFADQLYELKIPSIFDPGQVTPLFSKDFLLEIIEKSNILIGNIHEMTQIKNKTGLTEEKLIEKVKAIITTKGSEGSELILKDENNKIIKEVIPICKPDKVADTTGAGDGYRAGLLTGLTLNLSILDSCRLGAVIGSFVVETSGAQTQNYSFNNVKERFHKTFSYTPSELDT